ncbi:hypothetical protein J437_LFUL018597 [Ladona fulva]|uniref:HTH OST-type domain-containing protein n=1 Tax=Ladona fulva TaxID=123851 RepID=A0A8K0KKK8_LADFU|nr:hypothetical protein J437_LFUL018597 [Ladona fulva]
MRHAPQCSLFFNKFIPAYHHHFGHQCRVADYGFTKLIELFEAIPEVAKILFTVCIELIILNLGSPQGGLEAWVNPLQSLEEGPGIKFNWPRHPDLLPLHQLVCIHSLEDGSCKGTHLLDCFTQPLHGVIIFADDLQGSVDQPRPLKKGVAPDAQESESPIPGASLTVDSEESDNSPFPGELILPGVSCEPPRSSLSSREDVGLRQSVLRGHFSAPSKVGVRGPFAEPSKVFKFSVSILVPRVVREIRGPPMQSPACMDAVTLAQGATLVEETSEGDRRVTLTLRERLKVLSEQMVSLVQSSGWASNHHHPSSMKGNEDSGKETPPPLLPLSAIPGAFLRQNGYALHYEDFECESLEELMRCISSTVEVIDSPWGPLLSLVDQGAVHRLEFQVRCILLNAPNGRMNLKDFIIHFQRKYPGQICSIESMRRDLISVVKVMKEKDKEVICLTPLEIFGQELLQLLGETPGGRITFSSLENRYLEKFGVAVCPARLGFPSLLTALHSLQKTVVIRGRGQRRSLSVNPELVSAGLRLPLEIVAVPVTSKVPKETHPSNVKEATESVQELRLATLKEKCSAAEAVKLFEIHSEHKVPSTSQGWPKANSQEPFPTSALAVSCSLLPLPCPIVPPDPSELPFPLLGLPRSTSTALLDSGSGTVASLPSVEMPDENPVRRRMKMKAHFDSPLLLP